MRQPISVLVYAVRPTTNDWEVLLLHRVPMPDLGLPAFWQGVTGGLEDGETAHQAAIRELTEETALHPSRLEPIGFSYTYPIQPEWRQRYGPGPTEILEHVFIAFIDSPQEPTLSWEHDQFQWRNLHQALGLLKHPENIEALKRCQAHLEAT